MNSDKQILFFFNITFNMVTLESYKRIWSILPTSVEANLLFAKEVAAGNAIHQSYFFAEYSKPILSWIIVNALYKNDSPSAEREILGQYYEFVAGPFKESIPQWSQLRWYKGLNKEKLHTWLKRNGCQWFRKINVKEEKSWTKLFSLIDISRDRALSEIEDEESISDVQLEKERYLNIAWGLLNEKDRKVLTMMVIDNKHWTESWIELSTFINPKCGRDIMNSWPPKLKQDSLARLKERALDHLSSRYKIVNKNNY